MAAGAQRGQLQSWINHKDRKDRKEETPQVLVSAFFAFFAVKIWLELHDPTILQCKEGRGWRMEDGKGAFVHHSSARFVAPRERRPTGSLRCRFTRFRKVKGGQN